MPARRRFAGSESDDNFSVLIDSGIDSSQFVENNFSGDEKKKYATTKNFYSVGGFSVPTNFGVPKGLTKISSSIGTFLQQQLVQPGNEGEQFITTAGGTFDNNSILDSNTERRDQLPYSDFEDNELVVMACRDRTSEFASAIRAAQARNISRAVNIKDPRKATQMQSYSEFLMIAKHIGKNIASTYSKLEKLTLRMYFDVSIMAIINSY